MANRYLKAAGGNWTAAGTWSATGSGGVDSAGPPTAADNCILEAGSGNVTIDSGAVCRSIDCTSGTGSYAGTITGVASINLTIGDATAGAGNVALKFSGTTTYTVAANSGFNFISTSTTQQTVDFASKTNLGNALFNGVGGSWILGSNYSTAGGTTLTSGTLNTNGFTVSCISSFTVGSSTLARTLTLGSSTINITGAGAWNGATVTNLTVTANTGTVNMSGASAVFNGSNFNWNGLSLNLTGSGQASVVGQCTLANLTRIGTAIKTDSLLTSGAGPTITGTLTLTGNSVTNRLIHQTATPGNTTNVTAAAVSITNVDFMDVAAAGAAIPWTGTSLGNCLGCSNITFDTPVTQTRTGANFSWSNVGLWTSRVPLPQDPVIVSSGATGAIGIDMPRIGASVDYTGFAGTASISTANTIFGNLTYSTGMTLAGTATTTLGGRSTHTLTTAGKTLLQGVTINAPGGTYNLQDAYNATARLTVSAGTFNSNDFNLSISSAAATYVFAGTSSFVNLGTSTWTHLGTATNPISATLPAANFSGASSTLVIGSTLATQRTPIFTSGISLGTLTYTVAGSTGGLLPSNGSLTIGTLNFSDASNARTLTITSTSTLTILNAFNVNGTPGNLITINSTVPGSAATLSKSSGSVSSDYLSIQDSTATGGASWYAGTHSVNVSNNTGWFFTAPSSTGWFTILPNL